MGDIFREVEDDLKQERYERLWRRYGAYVIAGAVLLVAAVAGWQGWSGYQASEREAEGLRYGAAVDLAQSGRTEEAEAVFLALAEEAGPGYRTLSRLRRAALRVEAGDHASAVEIYDGIAADRGIPESLKGLATVLAGLQALHLPEVPADTIVARIEPLTGPEGAYRHVAREILALAAQRAGDSERAASHYRQLVDDAEAPSGLRTRAAQMLEILEASKDA